MANVTVRAVPLYLNNKKVAEANEMNLDITPGRTPIFGAEGYACHSKGAVISSIDVNFFVPVQSMSVDVLAKLINQEDVTIRVPIGGVVYEGVMAITKGTVKSNVETGKCDGSATFNGGKLKVLG